MLLEAKGIRKIYQNGTVANAGVDLRVGPGEVHAVVGENGAGKSTLMKILFGIERPSGGTLMLDARPAEFFSSADAISAGIGMVFQHFSLIPSFKVFENVVLGAEPRRGIAVDRECAIDAVRALSRKFHLEVDPLATVSSLPVGQQKRRDYESTLSRCSGVDLGRTHRGTRPPGGR